MKRLALLNGQVKNLKIRQVTKSVFASNAPQKLAEAGALTAAALGSVYASSVMASSRLKMTQEVEVFSCEVNGVKLVGCFGEVTFMNYNEIEFVVEYIDEEKTEAIAYAARDKRRKVIWVPPYQDAGEEANRKKNNKFIVFLHSSAFLFLFILLLIEAFVGEGMPLPLFFKILGGMTIFTIIIALVFKFIARVEIKDARMATKIFEAFGYQKPSEVNLFENNLDIQLDMEDEFGKVLPDMPQWIYRYRDGDLTGDPE